MRPTGRFILHFPAMLIPHPGYRSLLTEQEKVLYATELAEAHSKGASDGKGDCCVS